jgi:uroporphyrinogen decarboxylase
MLLFRNLDNFKNSLKNKTQIWFLRQAGRYLKEYNETKKLVNSFLDLCYNPSLASSVTMQPIEKFDFDASIIFSDILVLVHALGFDVEFINFYGPVVKHNFKSFYEVRLEDTDSNKLNCVYDAIRMTRKALDVQKSLIGFCGAPWTLIAYILEGGSSKDFHVSKKFMYDNKNEFSYLISILKEAIKMHLEGQILAGCDTIQLFDSHSGVLDELDYSEYVLDSSFEILNYIKNKFPGVKIVWFPRNSFANYISRLDHQIFSVIDCISVDYSTNIDFLARNIDDKIFLQGNLDPSVLLSSSKDEIKKKVFYIMEKMRGRNHVFNLGHGVIKTTPVENVSYVIDLVRGF